MADSQTQSSEKVFARLDLCTPSPYSLREYAARFAWQWVHLLLFRPSPQRAYRWRGLLLRLFGADVSRHARVRPTVRVMHPWLLSVDDYGSLGDRVDVYNLGRIRIGPHVTVSQDAYLCAGTHNYKRPDMPLIRATITIEGGVWICAGAFVGPGVTVGVNSIVAARAVVVKDVPSGVIVGGNPAGVIGVREVDDPGGSA